MGVAPEVPGDKNDESVNENITKSAATDKSKNNMERSEVKLQKESSLNSSSDSENGEEDSDLKLKFETELSKEDNTAQSSVAKKRNIKDNIERKSEKLSEKELEREFSRKKETNRKVIECSGDEKNESPDDENNEADESELLDGSLEKGISKVGERNKRDSECLEDKRDESFDDGSSLADKSESELSGNRDDENDEEGYNIESGEKVEESDSDEQMRKVEKRAKKGVNSRRKYEFSEDNSEAEGSRNLKINNKSKVTTAKNSENAGIIINKRNKNSRNAKNTRNAKNGEKSDDDTSEESELSDNDAGERSKNDSKRVVNVKKGIKKTRANRGNKSGSNSDFESESEDKSPENGNMDERIREYDSDERVEKRITKKSDFRRREHEFSADDYHSDSEKELNSRIKSGKLRRLTAKNGKRSENARRKEEKVNKANREDKAEIGASTRRTRENSIDDKEEEEKEEGETRREVGKARRDESSSGNESVEENNDDKNERSKKGRNPDDNMKIKSLKKYVKAAGLRIHNYATFWENCKSIKAKIERLHEFLEENGVHGRPTLEKCAKAKKKRQIADEISSLDTNNIISGERVTRSSKRKSVTPPRESSSSSSDTTKGIFKRIKTLVDSDSDD